MLLLYRIVLAVILLFTGHSFLFNHCSLHRRSAKVGRLRLASLQDDENAIVPGSPPSDFDPLEFENALKKMGPVWGNKKMSPGDEETYEKIRKSQEAQQNSEEQIFRQYPYENIKLPILPNCNDYYSGKFEKYFWHQNSDQVLVYIPLEGERAERLTKKDINVKFEARKVTVNIEGHQEIMFQCMDRIIPDGSFWTFETDLETGDKYLQLDLEKRFRMINWKTLFGEPIEETAVDDDTRRSEMLKKLFAANQGMSKLTGAPPESIKEMMKNGELTKMISNKVYNGPEVNFIDQPEGMEGSTLLDTEDTDFDDMVEYEEDDDDDDDDDEPQIVFAESPFRPEPGTSSSNSNQQQQQQSSSSADDNDINKDMDILEGEILQ